MSTPESTGEPLIRVEMTPAQATEFVERLASEDAFRDRYLHQTHALLAEYGVDVPEEMIPEDLELPSYESLQSALDALRAGHPFTVSPDMGMAAAVVTYQCYMFMRKAPLPATAE